MAGRGAEGEQRVSDGAGRDEGRLVAGRYRLVERIGRGGMGTVWRAEDELLGRHVALKKLHVPPHLADDERATLYERTRREARSAARITHPNVVVVHDVVDDGGLPCIVMEYVPSRTLGDLIKEEGPVSPDEAARIGRGMIAALRAAHAAGVLHRDVKPGNVLLGAEGRVVLTDFGIAVASGTSTLTRTGELVGSVDYVAPERVRGGTPGPASDLWALGATLYQALEGRPPFRKDTAIETAYSIAVDPLQPPQRAGVLAPLIEQLLTKDPEERPGAETVELRLREPAAEAETAYVEHGQLLDRGVRDGDGTGTRTSTGTRRGTGPTAPLEPGAPGPSEPGPRPRRRGRRRIVAWAAAAVLVAAAVPVAGVLFGMLAADKGEGQDDQARETPSASASDSASPPTPKPSPLPNGYKLVEAKEFGLSVPVPKDWTRTDVPDSDIAFINPAGLVSLRINVLDFASSDPLQHWKDDEAKSLSEGKLPGYKQLRMQETAYRGMPAAIWEFTFQGRARQFRAIDLGFGNPGEKEYALYLSGPSAGWARHKQVFDDVRNSLRIEDN
ncbi:serine/threonine-protein kinase [Streptomyces sp. 8N616]|uniref:serine/threonine-protein kinase n=1 Tax=Streptomyces sp. 8N616 TaxID=3457414 RepID=UPI003FD4049D